MGLIFYLCTAAVVLIPLIFFLSRPSPEHELNKKALLQMNARMIGDKTPPV